MTKPYERLRRCLRIKKKSTSVGECPGARFSKVPIINWPGKMTPFTLKIEVSIVLQDGCKHSIFTEQEPSVNCKCKCRD